MNVDVCTHREDTQPVTDITTAVDLRAMANAVADALDATQLNPAYGIAQQVRNATTADALNNAAEQLEVLADAHGLHGTVEQYRLQDDLMGHVDRLRAIAEAAAAAKRHGIPLKYAPNLMQTIADHRDKRTVISTHGCSAGDLDAPGEWT